MSNNNKKRNTGNHKKEDGKFPSKNIKHNPQAESARATFGFFGEGINTTHGFHNGDSENKI